jgi:asparagine synthase (glutamine-hydrolysing)
MTLVLGHRRLAIIDLSSTGLQPMSNKDGSLWIVYNGEVYNYLELRAELEKAGYTFRSRSDTEVILYAYQAWGEDCVYHFNGMWAFAIADLQRQKLFCSRDRLGIKPFHYFFDREHFVFSSEIKQLLNFPFVPRRINELAVYEFLAYGAVEHCEETFFAGILNLLPGHNLVLDFANRSLATRRYYQPHFTINNRITLTEAAGEFGRLLRDSVRLRLRSDVEVGSCLSGGLDSSSIVCLMHRLLQEQGQTNVQHTFSSHFEEKEANELEYMQAVIQATGVQAHFTCPTAVDLLQDLERMVWHQEEPFGSTSIFAQWSVFKLVHEHGVKVMLDGQGADELLAGYLGLAYPYFKELFVKRQYFHLAREIWRRRQLQGEPWSSLVPGGLKGVLRKLSGSAIDWISPKLVEDYRDQSYYQASRQAAPFGDREYLSNVLYRLTFLNGLVALLKYEDRNSMAFSIEARVPFLDYRLIEFLFSLPSNLKIYNGYTKRVLREGMAGVLPEKIRWRVGKLGFATPEQTWQQTVLRPLIEQAVYDDRLRPFLIPDKAIAYRDQLEKYDRLTFVPWRWVNLSLWMKAYDLA